MLLILTQLLGNAFNTLYVLYIGSFSSRFSILWRYRICLLCISYIRLVTQHPQLSRYTNALGVATGTRRTLFKNFICTSSTSNLFYSWWDNCILYDIWWIWRSFQEFGEVSRDFEKFWGILRGFKGFREVLRDFEKCWGISRSFNWLILKCQVNWRCPEWFIDVLSLALLWILTKWYTIEIVFKQ